MNAQSRHREGGTWDEIIVLHVRPRGKDGCYVVTVPDTVDNVPHVVRPTSKQVYMFTRREK